MSTPQQQLPATVASTMSDIMGKAAAAMKDKPQATPEQTMAAAKVVDWLLVYFVHDFPWVSQLYYLMEKTPRPGMGTMGVSVNADRIKLAYDPLFVLSLKREEIGFVMVHECFHVLFHHCTKRIPLENRAARRWNIAADLAINCLIPTSSTCIMPIWKEDAKNSDGSPMMKPDGKPVKKGDRMGVLPVDHKLESKKAMEWYFEAIPEDPDQDGDGGGGDPQYGELDSHEDWEPSDLVDQEIANTVERINRDRKWGNLPAEMVNDIMAAQQSEVPWSKILRHALGDMMSKTKAKSMKKLNRRIPRYPWKGDIKTGVDRKLVAFDTSGSVGNDELEKFLSEVNRLVEDEQPVDAVCFDTQIHGKVLPFSRARHKYDFKGRGGTAFTPVVEFAKAQGYKHLIILTDGEAENPPHQTGLDILWVLTPEGADEPPKGSQGRFVKMKKLKNKAFR